VVTRRHLGDADAVERVRRYAASEFSATGLKLTGTSD
jgi:hypothetical protein